MTTPDKNLDTQAENVAPAKEQTKNLDTQAENVAPAKKQTIEPSKKPAKDKKAGLKLKFPVTSLHQMLTKNKAPKKVNPQVAIFLTAVEEYVAAEILELATNFAISKNAKTISEDDIQHVIQDDTELNFLFGDHLFAKDANPDTTNAGNKETEEAKEISNP